ncbi:hypothetical protein MNBD_GAMMA20-1672, partial [hydrothermal vent metagenome]
QVWLVLSGKEGGAISAIGTIFAMAGITSGDNALFVNNLGNTSDGDACTHLF